MMALLQRLLLSIRSIAANEVVFAKGFAFAKTLFSEVPKGFAGAKTTSFSRKPGGISSERFADLRWAG